jgi:hypothetical protein
MSEYKLTLVRKGYRRREIDDMCAKAQRRLDNERASPTGELLMVEQSHDHMLTVSINRSGYCRHAYGQCHWSGTPETYNGFES